MSGPRANDLNWSTVVFDHLLSRISLSIALLAAVPAVAQAQDAAAAAPSVTATSYVQQWATYILASVNQAAASPEALEAQRGVLRDAVRSLINFDMLAERTLTTHWEGLSEAQRSEFKGLLQELIETSYTRQLGRGTVEPDRYAVTFTGEREARGRTTVEASLRIKDKDHVVEFKLLPAGQGFFVYDIITDDVSLEESYAESFDSIIAEHGFDGLLQRMRDRLAELKG